MFFCLVLFHFLHFFMLFNMQGLVQTVNCGPILPEIILFLVGTELVLKTKHIQNGKKMETNLPSPVVSC